MLKTHQLSRRKFLQASAAASANLAALQLAMGEPTPTPRLDAHVTVAGDPYYPSPESKAGWRRCHSDEEVRSLCGMDPARLEVVGHTHNVNFEPPWRIVVVRHGYIVREWLAGGYASTTFNIFSCTKSFTATAFGLLFDDSRNHELPNDAQVDLESRAYDFIPAGHPLSDARKEKIRLKHLLSMTSGIPGEAHGVLGVATVPGQGELECALGKQPDRFGYSAALMVADPGEVWDYCDPAYVHLTLIFTQVMEREIDEFMQERIFRRIGIENYLWNRMGGAGHLGPHTTPNSDLHLNARDLARFGYLMARKGIWEGEQLVPPWWTELVTRSSQKLNPNYGYGWWVNTEGTLWPGVPKDAFALMGYASSRCYIVPSLDLVVARVGFKPSNFQEIMLLPGVVASILV